MRSSELEALEASQRRLLEENASLRMRLDEAEETLRAIRHGEVDALVVSGPGGEQVYTLESAEQPYRILIEQMQEGAVTLSASGVVLYCNLRFAQMLKTPHEKILASSVSDFVAPQHLPLFRELLQQGNKQSARAEITLVTGDNNSFPTYLTLSPLPVDVEGCICMIVTDLTEQDSMRRNQATIEALNARLRRAMTETHHRVKNSLQIMSALVDMQVLDNAISVPTTTIRNLNMQVRALAAVHDILTQQSKIDSDCTTISSQRLLEQLLQMLQEIASPRTLNYTIEDIPLLSQHAVALALIVNELVMNGLKHGKGAIEISFRAQCGEAQLEISDSGTGFSEDFDPSEQSGTGITLASNLVSWDLQGTIAFRNRPERSGTRVCVTFPLAHPAPTDAPAI
jgi:two-component sensor histidine kinase